jgi:hypothetical protein
MTRMLALFGSIHLISCGDASSGSVSAASTSGSTTSGDTTTTSGGETGPTTTTTSTSGGEMDVTMTGVHSGTDAPTTSATGSTGDTFTSDPTSTGTTSTSTTTTTGEASTGDSSSGGVDEPPEETPGELTFSVATLSKGWSQYWQGSTQYRPAGEVFALAVEPTGSVHVAHHDGHASQPTYRFKPAGLAWDADDGISDPVVGGYTPRDMAIGVDAEGLARIGIAGMHYVDYPNYLHSVHHTRTDSYKWFFDHPMPGAGMPTPVPTSAAMVIDGDGATHLVYASMVPNGQVYERRPIYARFDGQAWSFEEIDDEVVADDPRALALQLGPDERPRVAYAYKRKQPMGQDSEIILGFAQRELGGWAVEAAEDYLFARGFLALALQPDGSPTIAFADAKDSSVWITERDGGVWTREKVDVDPQGDVGWGVGLAADAWGRPHVSHADRTTRRIRLARRVDGAWDRYVLEPAFSEGQDLPYHTYLTTELAIDAEGAGHLLVGGFNLDYIRIDDPTP